MKRHRYQWLIAAVMFIGIAACTYVAQATEQVAGMYVTVEQDQTTENDLILAGKVVQVRGEAKNDLIAAGEEVTITGSVQGYSILAGSRVNVTGAVGNDLFAAGGKLKLDAAVSDNIVLAGGEISLTPNAAVHHDALLAGGKVEVAGKVTRNLRLAAGDVRLSSEVGGTVQAHVGKLTVLPTAVIRGKLKVFSPVPPDVSPQAQVLGGFEYIKTERENPAWAMFKFWGYSFLALVVVGLAALALGPLWPNRVVKVFTNQTGETLLTGIVGICLIPAAIVVLMVTVIGIPLAFIVLALFIVALMLSGVFASWFIGGWMLTQFKRQRATNRVQMVTGALVVSLLVALPVLGFLFGIFILLAGLGALLMERRASWRALAAAETV